MGELPQTVVIDFTANPMQRNFIESREAADLFSSRMGEGKSAALCWAAYYHARHNPGASAVLIRDTYENMQKSTQEEFFKWFPPGVMGTYKHSTKEFTWAAGVAEGKVGFMGADDQQDASKLMSRAFGFVGMDEPAPAVGSAGIDEMVFDIAMSRLRQPGMKWHAMKLAENNPDETHWSYRRFVQPGTEGYVVWQPPNPENAQNLRPDYYAMLRKQFAHRPDLIRRFVDGRFGFQMEGKAVTPQWEDERHLALGLYPLPRHETYVLWDFGLNPTMVCTQITSMGEWHILDAIVGDGIGVEELINDAGKPLLTLRYKNCPLVHIGDPQGNQREQSSAERTAVRVIKKSLGGAWRNGPVKLPERIEPLRAVLKRAGVVRVDRERASAVWHALRGGWHFHVARNGIVSGAPVKNIHSHPGDAMSYGAAVLFPLGRLKGAERHGMGSPREASYFGRHNAGLLPVPPKTL